MSPFYSQGVIRFGTKSGVTEVSERMENTFIKGNKADYEGFAREWLGMFIHSILTHSGRPGLVSFV